MTTTMFNVLGIKIDPKEAKKGGKAVRGELVAVEKSAGRVKNALIGAFAGFSAAAAVREFTRLGDEAKSNAAKIALVTDGTHEYNRAQKELLGIAQETRTQLSSTVDLYTRLERALDGQEVSQGNVLRVTETLNKALKISGATAAETSSVITQLSQGLGAGALRGEEFNATAEAGSRIMQILKDELGKTTGELREMAKEGELTTEVITSAILNQSEVIDQEYKKIPATVSQAFVQIQNAALDYVGRVDEATGITDKLSASLQYVAEHFDEIAGAVGTAAKAVLVLAGAKAIGALIASFTSLSAVVAAATIKVVGFGQAVKAAFLANPIGGSLVVAYALYEFIDAMVDGEKEASEFEKQISKINESLATPIDLNNIEAITDKYRTLRVEAELLTGEIRRQKELDVRGNEVLGIDYYDEGGELERDQQATLGRISLSEKLTGVLVTLKKATDDYRDSLKEEEDTTDSVSKAVDALTDKREKAFKALVKSVKTQNEQLKARIKVLKGEENALLELAKKKALANAKTEEEIRLVQELYNEREQLNQAYKNALEGQEQLNSAQRIYNEILSEMNQALPESIKLEMEREERLNALDLLRQKGIITEMEYAAAVDEVVAAFQREEKAIKGVNTEAAKSKSIFQKFFDSIKEGFKSTFEQIKQSFQDDPLGTTADLSSLLPEWKNIIESNDSTARALNEIAATIPIPEVQAVAAILDTIDQLFGGNLLGTNYEVTGSGFDASIGAGGVAGQQYLDESRKRSLFRGTRRRRTYDDLDSQLIDILDQAYDASLTAAQQAAQLLGVEMVDLVTLSISQSFDANGNLLSSTITDQFGNIFNEGIEEFGLRMVAENRLAQAAQLVGDVDVEQQVYNNLGGSEFGNDFGVWQTITVQMNEVQAIADRWRHNAELLEEGSRFIVAALADMQNGFNLLGDGTLTQITNLTEELAKAGEPLTETYIRLVASTQIFNNALDLMNVAIEHDAEQRVRYAAEITDAAGGLEPAQRLWKSYFDGFFTQNELITRQLELLNDDITTMVTDLGQDVNFNNFRELFTEALPTLSPNEVVQWLELGEALSQANQLAGQLGNSEIVNVLEQYANITEAVNEANYSLSDQMSASYVAINELIGAYDGSISSERQIAAAMTERYNMELNFIAMIEAASMSIDQMISNSIDSIRLSQMTDEERYDFLTGRAESLAESILGMTDPEEIERAVAEINRLQNDAFGLLAEDQQSQMADGFVDFLENVNQMAQDRLSGIGSSVEDDTNSLIAQMEELLISQQQQQQEAMDTLSTSADTMNSAVIDFAAAVQRMQNITITVNTQNDNFDVSNF